MPLSVERRGEHPAAALVRRPRDQAAGDQPLCDLLHCLRADIRPARQLRIGESGATAQDAQRRVLGQAERRTETKVSASQRRRSRSSRATR